MYYDQDRQSRFGEIQNGEMILNELGNIAYVEWLKLAERFSNFELDVFQIMPNHIHGIILLNDISVGAGFTPAQNDLETQIDPDHQNNTNVQIDTNVHIDTNHQHNTNSN